MPKAISTKTSQPGAPLLASSARSVNRQTISSIGFTAMTDAANLDGVGIWANEEEAVVSYTQPKFVSSSESFHVTHARLRKAKECGEDIHRDGLAQAADITFGRIGPDNPLHFGSR